MSVAHGVRSAVDDFGAVVVCEGILGVGVVDGAGDGLKVVIDGGGNLPSEVGGELSATVFDMSAHFDNASCLDGVAGSAGFLAVEGIDHRLIIRCEHTQCRVAEEHEVCVVDGVARGGDGRDDVALGLSECLSHTDGLPVVASAEHVGHKSLVDFLVLSRIDGSGCGDPSDGSSAFVEQRGDADGFLVLVEGSHITTGGEPQRVPVGAE